MKILIIAAHPDDEILGCGATVAKMIKDGANAKTIILGQGLLSRKSESVKLDKLRIDANKANHAIGIDEVVFYNFPDNSFDTVPLLEVVKTVEKEILDFSPDIVFTHYGHDLNVDHRICFQAVMTACRPQPQFKKPSIYSFFIVSSTDWIDGITFKQFTPNVFIDIAETINLKKSALEFYSTEMRVSPHSRSMESIEIFSRYWGNRVGMEYIEPFILIRGYDLC